MKKIINSIVFALALPFVACDDGQFQGAEDMWDRDVVYSSKITYVTPVVGFERLKLFLYKMEPARTDASTGWVASSKPLTQIYLANARKIVVKYDDVTLVYDEIADTVVVPGLTQKRLYRFNVYTMDAYGNLSVPATATGIPYVQSNVDGLIYDADTTVTYPSRGAVSIRWPRGINNDDYVGMSVTYTYTDQSGTPVEGYSAASIPIARLTNLRPGSTVTVHLKIMVVPFVNKNLIIDEVPLETDIEVVVPV
jgi:hypothetical protein